MKSTTALLITSTFLLMILTGGCGRDEGGVSPGNMTAPSIRSLEGYCYAMTEYRAGALMRSAGSKIPPLYSPVSGVKVTSDRSSEAVLTDDTGHFSITAPSDIETRLSFSKDSLKTKTLTVCPGNENTVVSSAGYDGVIIPPADASAYRRHWSYICYIASDNSLGDSNRASRDAIELMETVGSTQNVHIPVLFDEQGSDTKLYYVTKDDEYGSIKSPFMDCGSNLNTGDSKVLGTFVSDAMELYPADHYVVDIWSHGSGPFKGMKGSARLKALSSADGRDICFDETSSDQITLPELGDALSKVRGALGKKIDILVLSACLMGSYETMFQVGDSAGYCVCSAPRIVGIMMQGNDSNVPVQPYRLFLKKLDAAQDSSADSGGLAKSFAEDTFNEHVSRDAINDHSFAAVNLAMTGQVRELFASFALECRNALSSHRAGMQGHAMKRGAAQYDLGPQTQSVYRDLRYFASSVSSDDSLPLSLRSSASALVTALTAGDGRFILYGAAHNPAGSLKDWSRSAHLSIVLPFSDKPSLPSTYSELEIAKTSVWLEFISGLFPFPAKENRTLFASDRGGTKDIYMTGRDGSDPVCLTGFAGNECRPCWSPDRKRLAFVSDLHNTTAVYILYPDGLNAQCLWSTDGGDYPDWSPDGSTMAFVLDNGICTVNPDTEETVRILNGPSACAGLSWSPDGTKIAFGAQYPGDGATGCDIYTVNSDGSGLARLTGSSGDETMPRWSPDGTKIVCQKYSGSLWRICTMNRDGTGQALLADSQTDGDKEPCWSSDGARIIFTGTREDRAHSRIYVMNADGSSVTRLTDSTGNDSSPFW